MGRVSRIVIPARLESTRLPRKLLLAETGKPLIQHTYESARRARLPSSVCVATDSQEIAAVVASFGGQAVMTSPAAPSGTDRVAEVAAGLDADIIVNVQGDEPEISGDAIDRLIQRLLAEPEMPMATVATPLRDARRLADPATVKVVVDHRQRALYFSRAPIPFPRDRGLDESPHLQHAHLQHAHLQHACLQHLGLYAYRRDFLLSLPQLDQPDIEKIECLEQLRVLWAGYPIAVELVAEPTRGIDTPEDYRAFVSRWRNG